MRAGCVVVAVLGVAAGSRPAAADEPRDGTTINGRFSIEETNDKFAIWKSTDSQFTQGLKLNRMFEDDLVEADRRWLDADFTLGAVARLWTFELEFSHTAAIKATGKHDLSLEDIDHHVGTFKLSALF